MAERMLKFTVIDRRTPEKREVLGSIPSSSNG